jgi:hypothetical protein
MLCEAVALAGGQTATESSGENDAGAALEGWPRQ